MGSECIVNRGLRTPDVLTTIHADNVRLCDLRTPKTSLLAVCVCTVNTVLSVGNVKPK